MPQTLNLVLQFVVFNADIEVFLVGFAQLSEQLIIALLKIVHLLLPSLADLVHFWLQRRIIQIIFKIRVRFDLSLIDRLLLMCRCTSIAAAKCLREIQKLVLTGLFFRSG